VAEEDAADAVPLVLLVPFSSVTLEVYPRTTSLGLMLLLVMVAIGYTI
jgi:hypothetical protein